MRLMLEAKFVGDLFTHTLRYCNVAFKKLKLDFSFALRLDTNLEMDFQIEIGNYLEKLPVQSQQ